MSFEQDGGTGVTAVLQDRRTVPVRSTCCRGYYHLPYIGADGANSSIRGRLGIDVDGPGVLYHTITAIVEAGLTLRAAWPSGRHSLYLQRPRQYAVLLAHDAVGKHIGSLAPARSQAQVDRRRLLHRRERVVVGMIRTSAGLPARGGGQATCPQIPGTDLKVLGFNIGAPRSRAAVPRAGRPGVFLAGDLARVINPPRPAVGSAATTPRSPSRTPPQPGLEAVAQRCSTARLVPRATRYIPITQCERHQIGLLSLYMQQQAFAQFGSGMGQGVAEVPHSLTTGGGDGGLYRYTARRPYSARRRGHLAVAPPKEL